MNRLFHRRFKNNKNKLQDEEHVLVKKELWKELMTLYPKLVISDIEFHKLVDRVIELECTVQELETSVKKLQQLNFLTEVKIGTGNGSTPI